MPKYKCVNKDCEYFDRVMDVYDTRILIVNGEAIDKSQICFCCGDMRGSVREPGITTMIAGTNDQRLRMERQ